ncbi:hypothetical protein EDB89DRAFT_378068 [Lactarius sanguifluus]|nr:hypothetical protein EDB89DRAFT_378068 [Lactarius sanguifluus]
MDGCWHELYLELRTRSHHPLPDPALAHDDASPRFRREERESPSWDIDINTAAARGSAELLLSLCRPQKSNTGICDLSVEVKSTLPPNAEPKEDPGGPTSSFAEKKATSTFRTWQLAPPNVHPTKIRRRRLNRTLVARVVHPFHQDARRFVRCTKLSFLGSDKTKVQEEVHRRKAEGMLEGKRSSASSEPNIVGSAPGCWHKQRC